MLVMVGGEGGSKVVPIKLPNIPKYALKFKPFPDITSGNYKSDLLVGKSLTQVYNIMTIF
jgi:hypothetical protein